MVPTLLTILEEDVDEEILEEGEDDESANEYMDDEDISWKVRRAASKCLAALIVIRSEMLSKLFEQEKSSTSNLKIEALIFTRLVLTSHSPPVFHPHIKAITSPVISAVGEWYYKVAADALRVCGELVRVLRPKIKGSSIDFKPYVLPICNAIMVHLTNQDQDQEVKECAIT